LKAHSLDLRTECVGRAWIVGQPEGDPVRRLLRGQGPFPHTADPDRERVRVPSQLPQSCPWTRASTAS